jgi:hypothetical protein
VAVGFRAWVKWGLEVREGYEGPKQPNEKALIVLTSLLLVGKDWTIRAFCFYVYGDG